MKELEWKQRCIPADPGWHALIPLVEEDGSVEELWEARIVGWLVEWGVDEEKGLDCLTQCMPVLPEVDAEVDIIQDPDGRIFSAFSGQVFVGEEAVIEHYNKEKK